MDVHTYFILILSFAITLVATESDSVTYKLNDGNDIPVVALGTSLGHLTDGTRILSVNHSLARAVQWALEAGYRHIDTASLYRTEDEVGLGVRNYLRDNNAKRADVYITTKLWNDAHHEDEVTPALQRSLGELKMDYVDLYLMHYPMGYEKNGDISNVDYLETWRGLEKAKLSNLTRSIGVSNFNITQMKRLWDHAVVKPAVLQIEVNPTITQEELVNWCKEHGIIVMAYSPFGAILGRKSDAPPPRADNISLKNISMEHNKTVPQIILRYLLDRKLLPIPRSTNFDRIKENFNIFDFKLSSLEISTLPRFNKNYRLRTPVKWYPHPYFPFEKKNLTQEEMENLLANAKED